MAGSELEAFAYGEHLEGPQLRSLGFRLLVPEVQQPWSAEVESFARRLQGAPYPEHWPITDLFCSVLLENGKRLVALARYGLEDRTPSRRRGGLELIGIIGPGSLSVTAALAIYQWLRTRRASVEEPRVLGGKFDLVEVLAEAASPPPFGDSVPVLPVRLWQDGALLFAAAQSSDPDLRLGMLSQNTSEKWQWLPLVGGDFPISTFAQRGPLIAWTPHLTGVAVKLDQSTSQLSFAPAPRGRGLSFLPWLLLIAITGVNLWFTWNLLQKQEKSKPPETKIETVKTSEPETKKTPEPGTDLETVAQHLHRYFLDQGLFRELREAHLVQSYEKLNRKNDFFTVKSTEAKMALGALVELSNRKSPAQIEAVIRAINQSGKGLDEDVVNLIAQRVYQKLNEGP